MMDTIEMVNMMDMMEKMQAFCERAGRSGDDFQILCRSLGVAPDDANDWLLREIGVDGEEYLLALNHRTLYAEMGRDAIYGDKGGWIAHL